MSSGSIAVNSALAPAKVRPLRRVFLSARWELLAMLNWRVEPRLLEPLLPPGVVLDFHEGQTFISVVGFMFRDTRVLGVAIPGHRDFEEVNLRFYVRRLIEGEVRRGVAFVREIVPRWTIAQTARLCFNEPYVALPMQHEITYPAGPLGPEQDSVAGGGPVAARAGPGRVVYRWRMQGRWNSLDLSYSSESSPLVPGSHEEFIAEHYWGYCGQRRGATVEYEVVHTPWNICPAAGAKLDCPASAALYGPAIAEALAEPPTTAFLVGGSQVAVLWPSRIA